jgi:hypothetical protein
MRTITLLGCMVVLSACGSSSGTVTDAGLLAQPLPSSANQTPVQPTDSVPPANSQQAPNNSQPPPANTQQTPLASAVPSDCALVINRLRSAGCEVDNSALSECTAAVASGAPCRTQTQAVLDCLKQGFTCDANGDIQTSQSCVQALLALNTCLNPSTVTVPCSPASNCNGCTDACTACQCAAAMGQDIDCAPVCQITNDQADAGLISG